MNAFITDLVGILLKPAFRLLNPYPARWALRENGAVRPAYALPVGVPSRFRTGASFDFSHTDTICLLKLTAS